MRVLFFLLISVASFGQIPLWQLEYAPDSMKVIGAAADGEPIWVNKGAAIDTVFMDNDSLYYVLNGDTINAGIIPQGTVKTVTAGNLSPLFTTINIPNPVNPSIVFTLSTVGLPNRFFASPSSTSGVPSFRAMVNNDLPTVGGLTAGTYTNSRVTVNNKGIVTNASSGTPVTGESTTVSDTPTLDLTLSGFDISGKVDTSLIATKYDLTLITFPTDTSLIETIITNSLDTLTLPIYSTIVLGGTGITAWESPANTWNIQNDDPDQTVTLTPTGIVSVSGAYPNFTIGAIEVDGDTLNEIQTLSQSFTSNTNATYSLSDGGSVTDTTGYMRLETMDATAGQRLYRYKSNLGAVMGIYEGTGTGNIEVLRSGNLLTWGLKTTGATSGKIWKYNGSAWALADDNVGGSGTVTSVGLTLGTSGTDASVSGSPITSSGSFTLNLPSASASNRGLLTSADWTTFNNKFSLPSLTSGSVLFSNGSTIAQNNSNFFWNNSTLSLGLGTTTPAYKLDVISSDIQVHGVRIGLGGGSISTNLAIGSQALNANTSGTLCVALGQRALASNNAGLNVAIGWYAQEARVSGGNNLAVGPQAMRSSNLGTNNSAFGAAALYYVTGSENLAMGGSALFNLLNANGNVAVGNSALTNLVSSSNNTAIGYRAGLLTTGGGNLFLGYEAGLNNTTGSNRLYIANQSSKTLIYGEFDNDRVGINTLSPSRTLDVNGEVRIRDLSTTSPNGLVGKDADGVLSAVTLGTGLSWSGTTLNGAAALSGTLNAIPYFNTTTTLGSMPITYSTALPAMVVPTGNAIHLVGTASIIDKNNSYGGVGEILSKASGGGVDWIPVEGTDLSFSTKVGTDVILESSTGTDVILRDGAGTSVNQVASNVIKYDINTQHGELWRDGNLSAATFDNTYRVVDFSSLSSNNLSANITTDAITVYEAGTYEISYALEWQVNSATGANTAYFVVYKNGVSIGYKGQLRTRQTDTGSENILALSRTFTTTLAANDYVDLRYSRTQGSDTSINIYNAVFTIKRLY